MCVQTIANHDEPLSSVTGPLLFECWLPKRMMCTQKGHFTLKDPKGLVLRGLDASVPFDRDAQPLPLS